MNRGLGISGPLNGIENGRSAIGNLIGRRNRMTDKSVSEGKKRLIVAVPAAVAEATETAAQRDLASVSYIIRRALVNDLRERGLLPTAVA